MTSAHDQHPETWTDSPVEQTIDLDDALLETEDWDAEPSESAGSADGPDPEGASTGEYDLAERHALRRVAGLSTELEDITEVEYRQLRLERVVLVGVWTEGTAADAENSLVELAVADHGVGAGSTPRSPSFVATCAR